LKHQAIVSGASQLRPDERGGFPLPGKREDTSGDPNCGRSGNVNHHNWFSEVNESKEGDKVFAVIKATALSVEKGIGSAWLQFSRNQARVIR
jgi:hypothetical protein